MNRSEATVEELTGLLPGMDELEVLRLRLVGLAVLDPGKAWDSSSTFATVDKRILTPDDAERALDEAREALHRYVAVLHDGLRPVFRSFYEGDAQGCARHLISLGEQLEALGRVQGAGKCYRVALHVALPLQDKGPEILALRRIARVAVTIGDFEEAASFYERSAQQARDSGDLPGEVAALTGLGNVRMWQGRWAEAEPGYHQALELAESASPPLGVERGQIYNNLANLTTRQGLLERSELWFQSAFRLWEAVDSPVDLAICHFNRALLREAQERWEEARLDYEAALNLEIPGALRSLIATDYAEWWLHENHLNEAERWGRVAEEHAISAGSPYTLGHMYRGLGKLARVRGDADGFTFFEKALEIARDKGYRHLEADTLFEYAALRAQNGGAEEAQAFLERAREIYIELGAREKLEKVERALAELSVTITAVLPGEEPLPGFIEDVEPDPPLAATGG